MRAIEQEAARLGLPSDVLMENAGLAVARHTRNWLGSVLGRRFLVLVGPGNNGGDGLVVARHLHDWGADVSVYSPSPRAESDVNLQLCRRRDIEMVEGQSQEPAALDRLLSSTDVVIDAFFGTGSSRPLDGAFRQALLKVREARARSQQPEGGGPGFAVRAERGHGRGRRSLRRRRSHCHPGLSQARAVPLPRRGHAGRGGSRRYRDTGGTG